MTEVSAFKRLDNYCAELAEVLLDFESARWSGQPKRKVRGHRERVLSVAQEVVDAWSAIPEPLGENNSDD